MKKKSFIKIFIKKEKVLLRIRSFHVQRRLDTSNLN